MIIDKKILDELTEEAKKSPRRRMNYDLRTSPDVQSQRMLNALEPGTVLPIHRHKETSETVVCIRGHFEEYLYSENANVNVNDNGNENVNESLRGSRVQECSMFNAQCSMDQDFRNPNGRLVLTEVVDMVPGGVVLNIPAGQWHSLKCFESGTVLLEAKDGAFRPLDDDEVWQP